MNILEFYMNFNFHTTEDGRRIYRPYGFLGKGRIIPGSREEAELKTRLRPFYVVILVATILILPGLGLLYGGVVYGPLSLALCVNAVIWNQAIARHTKGWTRV